MMKSDNDILCSNIMSDGASGFGKAAQLLYLKKLLQAQRELEQIRKSSISPLKFKLVIAVAVVLAFVVGALVSFGVARMFFGLRVSGDAQGACAAPGGLVAGVANSPGFAGVANSTSFAGVANVRSYAGVANSTIFAGVANCSCAPAGGEEQPTPPPSANLCEKAGSTVECLKFLLLLAPSPVVHVCVGIVVLSPMLFLAGIGKALKL